MIIVSNKSLIIQNGEDIIEKIFYKELFPYLIPLMWSTGCKNKDNLTKDLNLQRLVDK